MPVDKSAIGRTGEPVTMHVERGKIQEFARAIKDDDPLYYDEGHAAKEAGGIMPPVTFLQTGAPSDFPLAVAATTSSTSTYGSQAVGTPGAGVFIMPPPVPSPTPIIV
jgi:hypothetical protein